MKGHQTFLSCLGLVASAGVCSAKDGGQPKLVDETDCSCFLINGSSPTYYAKHMFFDFRSLAEFADVPDVLTSVAPTTQAPPTSDYFSSDNWTDVWELQGWIDGSRNDQSVEGDLVPMANSPNNVYIEKNTDEDAASDTFVTLRTKRLPKFQSAAEFASTSDQYFFVSIRILARTIGSPGAVTAMFTYRDSKKLADVQEADIEFLTGGPRDKIQYTNQPSYSDDGESFAEATRNASMPDGLDWTEWQVHRLDWTPERCVWYVNGEETANIKFQTPRDPARIIFNAWGNGGSWSGKMPEYDEAYLQIQWLEMVYNKTDKTDEGNGSKKRSLGVGSEGLLRRGKDKDSCGAVCSIDEGGGGAGEIVMLWDNAAATRRVDGSFGRGWAGLWAWTLCVALLPRVL